MERHTGKSWIDDLLRLKQIGLRDDRLHWRWPPGRRARKGKTRESGTVGFLRGGSLHSYGRRVFFATPWCPPKWMPGVIGRPKLAIPWVASAHVPKQAILSHDSTKGWASLKKNSRKRYFSLSKTKLTLLEFNTCDGGRKTAQRPIHTTVKQPGRNLSKSEDAHLLVPKSTLEFQTATDLHSHVKWSISFLLSETEEASRHDLQSILDKRVYSWAELLDPLAQTYTLTAVSLEWIGCPTTHPESMKYYTCCMERGDLLYGIDHLKCQQIHHHRIHWWTNRIHIPPE